MPNLQNYNGVDVFNAIRNSTPTISNRYPAATASTLSTIGKNIAKDSINIQMDYLNGLLKMVSAVFVKTNTVTNPLSELVRGGEYYAWGDLIESISVHVAKSVNPKFLSSNLSTGATLDPFVQNEPDLFTEFWQSNLPLQYMITVSEWQLQRAFESAQGMSALISQILESIQNGINVDLYLAGKDIFNSYINDITHTLGDGQIAEVTDVTDAASGKSFVLAIKNIMSSLQFPTNAFNPAGITKTSSSDTMTLYCRPDLLNKLSTEVWASAFNREDLDLTPVDGNGRMRIKSLDDFGGLTPTYVDSSSVSHEVTEVYNTLGTVTGYTYDVSGTATPVAISDITWTDANEDIVAVLAGPDAFFMALRKQNYAPIYNPRGEYVNYFYNMEYWVGYSNAENVIIIKKAAAQTP